MQQGTGTSKPEYTEARDFTQTPRPASLAQSVASAPNACRESENIRGSSTGHDDASLHSDLGPELARRYTTIIPARGRRQDAQESCHTLPMTSDSTKRPFFISPFLKTPKTSRDVSPARNPEANLFRTRIAQPEKRNTDDTEKSSCTKEWEHHVRMEQKRRVREFPRRLVTSIIGGIFVIVPMVIMSIDRSLTKDLITSSIAVLLFGVTLAWVSTSDEVSLFVATVGYAAFLAVFVALGDEKPSGVV